MFKTYTFTEHALTISGEKHDLLEIARLLRENGAEGTIGDLVYQIEYHFDVDGIRTENEAEIAADEAEEKDEWFGIVRWHEDDIREALLNCGFEPTEEAIRCIRSKAEHHFFKDSMIETGCNLLYAYIDEEAANLEPQEE